MRIQVLNDLHNEFGDFRLKLKRPDVVILAGDVLPGPGSIDWIKRNIPGTPVIFVAGNHEFYHHSISLYQTLKRLTRGSHIHFLEQEAVTIGDVVFLGTTLWTDFKVCNPEGDYKLVEQYMNDYRLINNEKGEILKAEDTLKIHENAVKWLKDTLPQYQDKKKVIVTHHAPSALSLDAEKQDQVVAAGYASHLDELVAQSDALMWVHGHIHEPSDYKIGNTRVLNNPRGYIFQKTGFSPQKIVTV